MNVGGDLELVRQSALTSCATELNVWCFQIVGGDRPCKLVLLSPGGVAMHIKI